MFDQAAYMIEYRKNNEQKLREYNRAYYAENADKIKERSKVRYRNNPDAIRERARLYAARNKEKIKANNNRYWHGTRKAVEAEREKDPEYKSRLIIARLRSSARRRGLECSIVVDDILPAMRSGVCEVTGLAFDMNAREGPWRPTIDRIDSSRGYIAGNVQIVVWIYNAAKQQYSAEDVMRMARALIHISDSGGTETQGAASEPE